MVGRHSLRSADCTYFDELLERDVGLEQSLVELQSVVVTRTESTINALHSFAHRSAKLCAIAEFS